VRRRVPAALALLFILTIAPVRAHWPVADRSGFVSQWYSAARHHGIDIQSDCLRRVIASRPGKVVRAGWRSNGGGWQVWVRTFRSGKDLYTIYAHMAQRPSVAVGQWVRTEQRLGYVGSTGNSSGCHLHIEMWRGFPWYAGSWTVNPWGRISHGTYLPYRYR